MKRSTKPIMYHFLLSTAMLVVSGGPVYATLSDCLDATCRISTSKGALGTGCCFHRASDRFFVLTAAHVVESTTKVDCEFWRRGHLSSPIQGTVFWRSPVSDLAIIAVAKQAFGGVFPAIVPLADSGKRLRSGDTIYSVGCANGSWPTAWKGHFLGYEQGDVVFRPPPASGRSGSAVFDSQCQRIVAIVRARSDQRGVGIATSVCPPPGMDKRTETELATQHCPDGSCELPRPFSNLLPNDGWRASPSQPAWPTLPDQVSETEDLRSANQKLDEIAGLLKQLIAASQGMPGQQGGFSAAPVQPTPPQDPGGPGNTPESNAHQIGELKENVSSIRRLIEGVAGDMETIPDRFAARLEKVSSDQNDSIAQTARAYARDYLAEKIESGAIGWSTGKMLGGALGLSGPLGLGMALGMWFLSRRIGRKLDAGDSLLIERLGERLSKRLDNLKNRSEPNQ